MRLKTTTGVLWVMLACVGTAWGFEADRRGITAEVARETAVSRTGAKIMMPVVVSRDPAAPVACGPGDTSGRFGGME